MEPALILYPAFAMAFWTLGLFLYLGFHRYRAVSRREASVRYYRLYKEEHAARPDRLRLLERHVQNQFEAPPLFYAAVLIGAVTGQVTTLHVVLAWLFVGGRVVHTAIHLGYNNVLHRFMVFGATVVVLALLWGSILLHQLGVF